MRISVVVPVYNVEKWLSECLDSLVNQSVPFEKIVVIDDGSTDASGAISDKYRRKYENIIVVHQKNRGLGAARNKGLELVESEFVIFVDSDDLIELNTNFELMSIIEKNDKVDAIYYDGSVLNDNKSIFLFDENRYIRGLDPQKRYGGLEFFAESIRQNYVMSSCLNVYRTELLKSIGFLENVYYEDNFTTFVYMTKMGSAVYLDRELYIRRVRDDSIMTSNVSMKNYYDICSVYKNILIYIDDHKKLFDGIEGAMVSFFCIALDAINRIYDDAYTSGLKLTNDEIGKYLEVLNKIVDDFEEYNISLKDVDFAALERVINPAQRILEKSYLFEFSNLLNIILNLLYVPFFRDYGIDFKDETKKYGFYGVGAHTRGILNVAKLLYGGIKARTFFYATSPGNELFCGEKVHLINDVDNSLDGIIISSYVYGQEMIKEYKKLDKPVHYLWFYEDGLRDYFSWINTCAERLTKS